MYRWILHTNENGQPAQTRVNQPLIIDEQYDAERGQTLLQIETLFLRLLLYQGVASSKRMIEGLKAQENQDQDELDYLTDRLNHASSELIVLIQMIIMIQFGYTDNALVIDEVIDRIYDVAAQAEEIKIKIMLNSLDVSWE